MVYIFMLIAYYDRFIAIDLFVCDILSVLRDNVLRYCYCTLFYCLLYSKKALPLNKC